MDRRRRSISGAGAGYCYPRAGLLETAPPLAALRRRWDPRSLFERFTERARQVVALAQEEARTLRHDHLGTEHILLGLLREHDGVAAQVLESFDITLERTRGEVVRIVGVGQQPLSGQIPFTPRRKQVLELAMRQSIDLGHNYIDPEHILLALTTLKDATAIRILGDCHADPDRVRAEVLQVVTRPPEPARPTRPRNRRRAATASRSGSVSARAPACAGC